MDLCVGTVTSLSLYYVTHGYRDKCDKGIFECIYMVLSLMHPATSNALSDHLESFKVFRLSSDQNLFANPANTGCLRGINSSIHIL